MRGNGLTTAAYVLALVLAVGYAAAGIIGWIADVTEGDGSDLAFWVILLLGGAALILAGLFLTPRWTLPSILLVSVGALAGALALFWSVIVPVLAIALIVMVVLAARRRPAVV